MEEEVTGREVVSNRKRLGEILLEKGIVNERHIKVALSIQGSTEELKLGEVLIRMGVVTPRVLGEVLAEQHGMEYADLSITPPTIEAVKLVPKRLAERYKIIPIYVDGNKLVIGVTDPNDTTVVDILHRSLNMAIERKLVDIESYTEHFERVYYFVDKPIEEQIKEIVASSRENRIPQLIDLIIQDCIRVRGTDIHLSPTEYCTLVFFRIDGVLNFRYSLPKNMHAGIVSRLKVMSQMDISKQKVPQDGSFSYSFLGQEYDMRVSTVPAVNGENVVIRLLNKTSNMLELDYLGFSQDQVQLIRNLFSLPYGMVLISGPTGSGKTTTLYSALKELNLLEKNVLTVEDPVEYRFMLVRQTQLNEEAGYTFNVAGKHFMRQDPDVILIGEIRDPVTAEIAVRAAVTGHLVLATIHTNDSFSVVSRLFDLGVDPSILGYALKGVIAQRLVRRTCPYCRETARYEIPGYGTVQGIKGKGCPSCNNTGYLGRLVISETLVIDPELSEMISERKEVIKIRKRAVEKGMKLLFEDGISKVIEKQTTYDEVLRVAGDFVMLNTR